MKFARSTTATRRAERQAQDVSRMVHVSQGYQRTTITDEAGVQHEVVVPMFTGPDGKAKGRTFNIGRNYRKRLCRGAGLNHVAMERHHGIKQGARKQFYPELVGA